MNQLVVLEELKPLEIFTPQGTDDILERLKKEAKSVVLDISTPDGRKQIASLAYKIAKSKTFLDDMGKELVSGWKEQSKLVDAERKRIRDELDVLRDEVRAPLTEWENREEQRVKDHETALLVFEAAATFSVSNPPSAEVQKRIDGLADLMTRDWQEFTKRSELARDAAVKRLNEILASSLKYESEQAELERLRREDAERKQREHDERVKAEAAAKAKAEAEAAAKAAADAEAERVRAVQEAAEKERQRIQREKEEAEGRAKKAEADKKAAAAKAEQDRLAAAEQAKRDTDAAIQRERDRVAAEQREEAEAAAKREADKKHKAKINNEVLNAIVTACNSEEVDVTPEIAKAVIQAIAKGEVPHVKISY